MCSIKREETWRKGIKITDLEAGDIIYVEKIKSNYSVMLKCEFIKFEKGIVYAKLLVVNPSWRIDFPIGCIVKARPTKTYLWGKELSALWAHCHWFRKVGKEFIAQ